MYIFPSGTKVYKYIFIVFLLLSSHSCLAINEENKTINNKLQMSTPEEQGMDSDELIKLIDFVQNNKINIHNITILRNGYKVFSIDFYPYNSTEPHNIASCTKSIISILIGIAIDKGYIKSVNEPFMNYFPEYKGKHYVKDKLEITIDELLSMSSGLCNDFIEGEKQLDAIRNTEDYLEYILSRKIYSDKHFAYCSIGSHLLSIVLSRATNLNAADFARKYLLNPMNINNFIWPDDPKNNSNGWGDTYWYPDDLAKIGQLYLNKGIWNGERLVSESWIDISTKKHADVPNGESYGYKWWIPGSLEGLYEARGRGEQRIALLPNQNLTVIMLGATFNPGQLGEFILRSIKSDNPLPENKLSSQLLNNKIEKARLPLNSTVVTSLNTTAKEISGKIFLMNDNRFDIKAVGFNFEEGKNEAVYFMLIGSTRFEFRPVGLDNKLRESQNAYYGMPVYLKGSWITENIFEMKYLENGFINDYTFTFEFTENLLTMHLYEPSGIADFDINGSVSDIHKMPIAIPAPSLSHAKFKENSIQPALIYLPPSYTASNKKYPVIYFLPGFTTPLNEFLDGSYEDFILQPSLDYFFTSNKVDEKIIVMLNGYNFLGGSFFTNSPTIGNWENFVVSDLISYIDENYRTLKKSESRVISGLSMGGYAALNIGMKYPDVFGHIYCFSPGIFDNNGFDNNPMFKHKEDIIEFLNHEKILSMMNARGTEYHFRNYINTLLEKKNGYRKLFTSAYGMTFATTKDSLFFNIPYKIENEKIIEIPELISKYKNGFGNWDYKIEQYKSNLLKLNTITIDYGLNDEIEWLKNGIKYLSDLFNKSNVPLNLLEHSGGHTDKFRERFELMLKNMNDLQ